MQAIAQQILCSAYNVSLHFIFNINLIFCMKCIHGALVWLNVGVYKLFLKKMSSTGKMDLFLWANIRVLWAHGEACNLLAKRQQNKAST